MIHLTPTPPRFGIRNAKAGHAYALVLFVKGANVQHYIPLVYKAPRRFLQQLRGYLEKTKTVTDSYTVEGRTTYFTITGYDIPVGVQRFLIDHRRKSVHIIQLGHVNVAEHGGANAVKKMIKEYWENKVLTNVLLTSTVGTMSWKAC